MLFLLLFCASSALLLLLSAVQYRSRQQAAALDCRCRKLLLEHKQNLPRPVVRTHYSFDSCRACAAEHQQCLHACPAAVSQNYFLES